MERRGVQVFRKYLKVPNKQMGLGPLFRVLPVDLDNIKKMVCVRVCAFNKSLNNGVAYLIVAEAQQCQ